MIILMCGYCCILVHAAAYWCMLLYTAANCCILLQAAAYCWILLHTAAYCCILLHTAAYCLLFLLFFVGRCWFLGSCCPSQLAVLRGTLTEPSRNLLESVLHICIAYHYFISILHICIAYLCCISVLADWTTHGWEGLIG